MKHSKHFHQHELEKYVHLPLLLYRRSSPNNTSKSNWKSRDNTVIIVDISLLENPKGSICKLLEILVTRRINKVAGYKINMQKFYLLYIDQYTKLMFLHIKIPTGKCKTKFLINHNRFISLLPPKPC